MRLVVAMGHRDGRGQRQQRNDGEAAQATHRLTDGALKLKIDLWRSTREPSAL
jgi:hypothetical protein